jgi:GT2 family glycosyltransferase
MTHPPAHPHLSVLIPTLGRSKEVIDTVRDLVSGQTRIPDEIVVVDQNIPSFPDLDEYLKNVPIVRHVRSATPGYAFNLNVGLKEVRGDIVLFLDDDVRLEPELVANHLRHYASVPGLAGVAGRVDQPHGDLDPSSIREIGRYGRWTGSVRGNFNARRSAVVQIAPGGNMSFRREALLGVGGFDLGFDGNGYRCETDACLRVSAAGGKIVFDPEAGLKHLMAPAGGCRITDKSIHTYYYVKNGLRLYRKHSPGVGVPWFVARMVGYVALKSLYNGRKDILARGLKAVWDGCRV